MTPKRSDSKKILILPTWRAWLRSTKSFEKSHYFWAWKRLLEHANLEKILISEDVKLIIFPHFRISPLLETLKIESQNIIFKDLTTPLHQIIKDCDLLITDYSSVMYDFFYQRKPVVCYMFDRKRWENQPPGPPHINFEKDLPADIHGTPDEVLTALQYYLNNNCEIKEIHQSQVNKFFKFRDNKNCERIYHAICQKMYNNNLKGNQFVNN